MAFSKCPKSGCDNSFFEMKELKVANANFRYSAIQCSSCGAVVSVVDIVHLPTGLEKIAKKLGISSLF